MRRRSLVFIFVLGAFAAARADDRLPASGFTIGSEPTTGAYFYKVMSHARTDASAIEGAGVLPLVRIDPAREHPPAFSLGEDEYMRGPLDVPSVYMGGNAGTELDAGLSWSRVLDGGLRPLWTDLPTGSDGRNPRHRFALVLGKKTLQAVDGKGDVYDLYRPDGHFVGNADELAGERVALLRPDGSVVTSSVALQPDFAFRPFWRTEVRTATGAFENRWANPEPGDAGFIFLYPGEHYSMRLAVAGPERVRLAIALENDPRVSLDVTFEQARFGTGAAIRWKRVNSIDQFRVLASGARKGNEDWSVIPTRTAVTGARWNECALVVGGARVPVMGPSFIEARGVELASRFGQVFRTTDFTAQGGESIDIEPAPPSTKGLVGKIR